MNPEELNETLPQGRARTPRRPSRRGIETRQTLVRTAERLFAERGVYGVPLREITRAAAQHNRSATQYHFGSRDDLIEAVLERRMSTVNERRRAMLSDVDLSGRSCDLRALVEVAVLPAVHTLEDQEHGWFFRFAAQLATVALAPGSDPWRERPYATVLRELVSRIDALLAALDERVRRERIRISYVILTTALADYEALLDQGQNIDLAFVATSLVDTITAVLLAPDNASALVTSHDTASTANNNTTTI